MTGDPGLASVLSPRLRALWGTQAGVTGVRPLPGGASRESWDKVIEAVRASVVDKLTVANPRHLAIPG